MIDLAAELVRKLHASNVQFVLAVTGGGSLAISQLLTVPGGSRTVLECLVPYAAEALAKFLGAPPEHYCSSRTARAMAMAAFQRARAFVQDRAVEPAGAGGQAPIVGGVACTASLASDRPKKGQHRAHLAVQTKDYTLSAHLNLQKGSRSRLQEEELLCCVILNLLAEMAGLEDRLATDLSATESCTSTRTEALPGWRELIEGRTTKVLQGMAVGRRTDSKVDSAKVVFPGAFNPRHEAHRRMAVIAGDILDRSATESVAHEISILNVDKPLLDYEEMAARAAQFSPSEVLWFTRAPTFAEKAALFIGATFVVGADTVLRVGQERYYGGDAHSRDQAIATIARHGCRFLVFCRSVEGKLRTLDDLELPPALRSLCREVPADKFRADISSSDLRKLGQQP